MDKRKKMILSITGIIIVSLFLIVYTFGYVLLKIKGNENSILSSFTSKKVSVAYNEISNTSTGETISPGYEYIKVFTATNDGNVEINYHIYLDNVENEFIRTQDITYTLYRSKLNGTIDTNNLSDSNIVASGVFPTADAYIKFNEEIKKPNNYYTYALKINYAKTTESQDEDDGHIFSFRVQLNTDSLNPYSSNTSLLAYNIINNAMNETNGTIFSPTPLTTPAVETSAFLYKTDDAETTYGYNVSINTTCQGYYWTYGTGYTVDESTGKFTLTGVSTCKYNDGTCHETLVGKYIVSNSQYSNSNSTDKQKTTTNLSNIYKVTTAPASSTSTITMETKKLSSISYSTEKVLSVTTDDYGTSYYYRGGVTDNYVNFAGMCWRIVRIEGNGSTKLILEDYNTTCNSDTFTGNWSDGNTYNFGNDDDNSVDYLNYSGGLADAFKSFYRNNIEFYMRYLTSPDWCYDDTVTNTSSFGYDANYNRVYTESEATNGWYFYKTYAASTRIETNKKPSLNCTGTKLTKYGDGTTDMYVATLTADEISFAGVTDSTNYTHYLMNDYTKNKYLSWWGLSPLGYSSEVDVGFAFALNENGAFYSDYLGGGHYARPAISLYSGITITGGDGTRSNPYTLEDELYEP